MDAIDLICEAYDFCAVVAMAARTMHGTGSSPLATTIDAAMQRLEQAKAKLYRNVRT